MGDSGTSLEALETGNIPDAADTAAMEAILREMNAAGASVQTAPAGSAPPAPQAAPPMASQHPMLAQQPMGGYPPMMMHMQQQPMPSHYIPMDAEDDDVRRPTKRRKNMWSTVVDALRDPLLVAAITFILSLPVLQTFLAKHATWAYAVGGQLSWLGVFANSILAGALFGAIRFLNSLLRF